MCESTAQHLHCKQDKLAEWLWVSVYEYQWIWVCGQTNSLIRHFRLTFAARIVQIEQYKLLAYWTYIHRCSSVYRVYTYSISNIYVHTEKKKNSLNNIHMPNCIVIWNITEKKWKITGKGRWEVKKKNEYSYYFTVTSDSVEKRWLFSLHTLPLPPLAYWGIFLAVGILLIKSSGKSNMECVIPEYHIQIDSRIAKVNLLNYLKFAANWKKTSWKNSEKTEGWNMRLKWCVFTEFVAKYLKNIYLENIMIVLKLNKKF